MRKRLSAVGNSLGIVIEKPILELLHIVGCAEARQRATQHPSGQFHERT